MRIDIKKLKSNLELQVLKGLKSYSGKNKYTIEYETENLDYKLLKHYVPDFILKFKNGRKIYIEVKGYLRSEDRTKLLAVKESHPQLDLRIIFAKDNKLNSRSRTRYSDWATRNNFVFSIGTIPEKWFQEQ